MHVVYLLNLSPAIPIVTSKEKKQRSYLHFSAAFNQPASLVEWLSANRSIVSDHQPEYPDPSVTPGLVPTALVLTIHAHCD